MQNDTAGMTQQFLRKPFFTAALDLATERRLALKRSKARLSRAPVSFPDFTCCPQKSS
jgi:hypothetical protein